MKHFIVSSTASFTVETPLIFFLMYVMKYSLDYTNRNNFLRPITRVVNFAFLSLFFLVVIVTLFYLFDKAAVIVAHTVVDISPSPRIG